MSKNIFDWEYYGENYVSKNEVIVKLLEFIHKEDSYEKFWNKGNYKGNYKPNKKDLQHCIIFLVNSDWKYILSCNNPSFENYVNKEGDVLDFDNPNIRWIIRADNKDRILEKTLCNFFDAHGDLYVVKDIQNK